jgi:hypothetical protein
LDRSDCPFGQTARKINVIAKSSDETSSILEKNFDIQPLLLALRADSGGALLVRSNTSLSLPSGFLHNCGANRDGVRQG